MAILQALLGLISRSAGKILYAIFGWAVRALFGRASQTERTLLSAVVGAAAVWPLLIAGLVAPKIATLLLAFVPIPRAVPSWLVRVVWAALVLLVPCAIGVAVAMRGPEHIRRRPVLRRVLSGFPITLGLATAFVIMFVTVPVIRLVAILKGEQTADVPLITETKAYHDTAALCVRTLNAHDFAMRPAKPRWAAQVPLRVLRFFSHDAFASFVPDHVESYRGKAVELELYPSGAMLRGKGQALSWAHGLIAEATAKIDGFQTSSSAGQDLESQVHRLWKLLDEEPVAHRRSARLRELAHELTGRLAAADVDYDDWQVIYRQIAQLDRALHGQSQLLETPENSPHSNHWPRALYARVIHQEDLVKNHPEPNHHFVGDAHAGTTAPAVAAPMPVEPAAARVTQEQRLSAADLSTVELVKQITSDMRQLVQKEVELGKTELEADLKAEAVTVGGLSAAAVGGLCTLNLLLVTVVLALSLVLRGWLAGLIVSGAMLLIAAAVATVAWRKRVRSPLARTQRTLKEDVQWTRERLV